MLEPWLPTAKPGGRHRGYALREFIYAIQDLIRGDGAWRSLPHDLPHWQSIYHYFRQWTRDGTWLRIHDHLHEEVRQQMGRDIQPSAAIIDSQSVKTTEKGAPRLRWSKEEQWPQGATFRLLRQDF
jgi:putative transposase